MRLIGHLKSESSAKTLGDYLISQNIRNMVEPDAEGWAVWIYSEDQIAAGQKALEEFVQNPGEAKFREAKQTAAAVEVRQEREKAAFKARYRTSDQIWDSSKIGTVTIVLMVISVGVTLLMNVSLPFSIQGLLSISEYLGHGLPEVLHGQIWRLLTPIFLHFGLMHILFNMLMLRDFGSLIEARQNSKVLIFLVVVIGIGSNLGQYFLFGPVFGGMSGVLYGLMGYVWLRGRTVPSSGYYISPRNLTIMLVWFFLCLFGVIPNVANGCHAFGLVIGAILGAIRI